MEQNELLNQISSLRDVESCISEELAKAVDGRDWDSLEVLLWAAICHPCEAYAPVLERMLHRREPGVPVEDLIEVLGEIGSETSVVHLERAMYWRPEWDEFHSVAVKCIGALAAIGNESAKVVVETVSSTAPEVVRDWAAAKLATWPKP
ncbi:hypothetical protein GCM10010123_38980 [Pilimelia anulata]|uniref:HEAT repeat domain-containing protein n=1 Tax=Pilimelia anulata TaxID=53371 RepID=A0A8J3FDQ2_9ACTN|nr:hypothetical protein [Pilimelia anulata]GGK05310.1 hypothetical protein GCM10010123_38980 [Pilimelia anulata]